MEGLSIKGCAAISISASRRPPAAASIAFLAPLVSLTLLPNVVVAPNSARSPDNHYELLDSIFSRVEF